MARAVLVVGRSSNLSEMLRKELDQLKREAERGRDSCLAVAFCSDCWEEAKERDAAIACTIPAEIITDLTWCRFIVFELI